MKRTKLSRRTMLRGICGGAAVAIGLPALEIFLNGNGTAYAAGDALPKRFGIFFWGNGVLPDRWVPKGSGPTWDLSPTLAPLAGVKDQISIITGMKVYTGNSVPHGSGPVGSHAARDASRATGSRMRCRTVVIAGGPPSRSPVFPPHRRTGSRRRGS